MTATIPSFDCGGAQIRAHFRHLATVVRIQGCVDAGNVDRLIERTQRFIMANDPVVLDLSGLRSFAEEGISLLQAVADGCRIAEIEWTLVPSSAVTAALRDSDYDDAFPTAPSAQEALHYFADVIDQRRRLLLPLVKKTA
jgi:anti-anti-sigma regulatory factor